jgi:hypothetical protein
MNSEGYSLSSRHDQKSSVFLTQVSVTLSLSLIEKTEETSKQTFLIILLFEKEKEYFKI